MSRKLLTILRNYKTTGLVLVTGLLLIYLLFFLKIPPHLTRSEKVLIDISHYPIFFCLSYLLIQRYRQYFGKTIPLSVLVVSVSLISMVTEWLQSYVGRTPDWRDIGFNMAGLTTAVILFHPGIKTLPINVKRLAMPALLLIAISPALVYLLYRFDEYRVNQNLPYLNNFDQFMAMTRIEANAKIKIEESTVSNRKALKMNFGTELYSDIDFRYLPRDWSRYEAINMQFLNDEETPFDLTFKLYDSEFSHFDRSNKHVFYRVLKLKPHLNTLRIEFDDIMRNSKVNLADIETLTLYTYREPTRRQAWLIDLSLQ